MSHYEWISGERTTPADSTAGKVNTSTSRKSKATKVVESEQNAQSSETRATPPRSLPLHLFAHPSEAAFAKVLEFYRAR